VKSKDHVKELRSMSGEQLDASLKDAIKNMFHLRCQAAAERLEAPSEMRKVRKQIAQIKTIQRERELAQAKAAGGAGKQ